MNQEVRDSTASQAHAQVVDLTFSRGHVRRQLLNVSICLSFSLAL